MLVVGLTGGIGSGKSAVAHYFAELGTPIIDADIIARLVVAPGTPGYEAIRAHFGDEIITPTSEINRSQLRKQIFDNPKERLWLEDRLHPLIFQEIKRQIAALHAPYVIVVIPLLVETLPHPYLDRILVVDADKEAQLMRAETRDKRPREQIEQILNSQASQEQRLLIADDVIVNDDTLSALKRKVHELHEDYLKIAKK